MPLTRRSIVQDEGVQQGAVNTFNFTGAGVTSSTTGAIATVNIPGGSGGSSFTATTITVPFGKQYQVVNVVDATIGVGSKIFITWGMFSDLDENTSDMDDIEFNAIPLAGSMDVRVSTTNPLDRVGGTYKIMYLVS